MPLPTTLTVHEYDGILALLDLQTYRQEVEWSSFDPDLIDHFTRENEAGHGVIWQTSPNGGGEFEIAFVGEATAVPSRRELSARIEVTAGRLHLVDYTELTMAADDPGRLPGRTGAEWYVEIPDGAWDVTIRQLFDPEEDLAAEDGPSFEIVLRPATGEPARSAAAELFWRS